MTERVLPSFPLELRHISEEPDVLLKAHVIVTPSGRCAAVHE
ncbi:hypothetical protein [Sorangium sp. So ce1000]